MGSPWAFVIAFGVIVVWGVSGFFFNFSNTWQLVINTGTTILTFLMVFLIQNTQNRDSEAMHLKLDEIIRAMAEAQNDMLNLEELDDAALRDLHARYDALATEARSHIDRREASAP